MKKLLVALGIAALSTGAMAQNISYVDISSAYTGRLQNSVLDGIFLPSDVSYVGKGDVQFKVDSAGNNYWNSIHQAGLQDVPGGGFGTAATVEFAVNSYGVRSGYSLIGTYWGSSSPSAKASIEFFGTNGAYYKKNLVGNVDIRDWNHFIYTNDINGTTTVNVLNYYSPGTHRMDMQEYSLPEIFATETLTSIRLTDQRVGQNLFLAGLALRGTNNPTNNAVPEPSEWAAMGLLGTGLLGLVVRGRKKKLAN